MDFLGLERKNVKFPTTTLTFYDSSWSSTDGSQNAILLQADAIIMNLGLN